MKFYVGLIVIVAVVVALLLLAQEDSSNTAASQAAKASVTPTPTPTPTPLPDYYHMTPFPTSAPIAPQPVANAGTAAGAASGGDSNSDACGLLRRLAPRVGARVVSCAESGGLVIVTVAASERNALGDFLDECQKNGMRDLLPEQAYRQSMDAQHRTVHQNTYKMRF